MRIAHQHLGVFAPVIVATSAGFNPFSKSRLVAAPFHVCFCDFCPLLGNRNTAECFGYCRIPNLPDLDMKFIAPASDRRHFRTSLCHSCANEDELRTTIRYDRCRSLKYVQKTGGAEEDRTPDLRIANATLSQLSYRPSMKPVCIFYCKKRVVVYCRVLRCARL